MKAKDDILRQIVSELDSIKPNVPVLSRRDMAYALGFVKGMAEAALKAPSQEWEPITPETTFKDKEWLCVKFLTGKLGMYQWSVKREALHYFEGRSECVLRIEFPCSLKFKRIEP